MKRTVLLLTLLAWVPAVPVARAEVGKLTSVFAQYCVACHGAEKQKGGIRLDVPLEELQSGRERLETILFVLEDGEMPPRGEPRPSAATVEGMLVSLEALLAVEAPEGTLKRLTSREYTHAINDRFRVGFDLTELLPPDHVERGFDKFGESHLMSPSQVQAYLHTARYVADRLLPERKPLQRSWVFDGRHFHGTGRGDYGTDEAFYLSTNYPWRSNLHFSVDPDGYERFVIPEFGRYRFEVEAQSLRTSEDQVIGVNLGDPRYPTNFRKLRRLPFPDGATSFTVELTLNEGDEIAFTFDSAPIWRVGGSAREYEGPQLKFTQVRVEGPLIEEWPAFAERLMLPESVSRPSEVVDHLSELLFHRPLPGPDRAALVNFAQGRAASGASRRALARSVLTSLLASPHFVYKAESPQLTDLQLAHRLSYFLWSSIPDEELLEIARAGRLRAELPAQAERMLRDPKAQRFVEDFTRQWLQLDRIDDIPPDERVFGDVTPLHVVAMEGEAPALFRHLLESGGSLERFIDADFVMVNDRLADLYGIPGVEGASFRPVRLPEGSERGGLVGQAGFLKLTSHTFSTSPILRGVWILENLYGEDMEPPADLEIEEPDIRGTTTVKEALAKHQQAESCFRCHSKIDPLGFALEYYDPVGRKRAEYQNVEVMSKEKVRIETHPIDAEMALRDGRVVGDMASLKRVLLEDREEIVRGVTGKLISYAVGRELTVLDRPFIEEILAETEESGHALREIVKAIVAHPVFGRK